MGLFCRGFVEFTFLIIIRSFQIIKNIQNYYVSAKESISVPSITIST